RCRAAGGGGATAQGGGRTVKGTCHLLVEGTVGVAPACAPGSDRGSPIADKRAYRAICTDRRGLPVLWSAMPGRRCAVPTLTMQSIADLTQVRRAGVSLWRPRPAGSQRPIRPALSPQGLVFEPGQVAAWLEATGRGNTPAAPLEVLLHSSQFDELLEDLDASSTLLLIHDLIGGSLSALSDTRPL